MNTIEAIRQRLARLNPQSCEILDDSHAHAGHAGARQSGGGHFQLNIVSEAFSGKSPIARHRMIYAALADLMSKEIHALNINATLPD